MITFTILLITLLVLAVIGAIATGMVGLAAIFTFGDVIICVLIVGLILKYLFKKMRK